MPTKSRFTMSITDLYLSLCQPANSLRYCAGRCGRETRHVVQQRLATTPNVLLLHVDRIGQNGRIDRTPIAVDEELCLPCLSPLEASAVIYLEGSTLVDAHYTCVSRGPDGRTARTVSIGLCPWHFNDSQTEDKLIATEHVSCTLYIICKFNNHNYLPYKLL